MNAPLYNSAPDEPAFWMPQWGLERLGVRMYLSSRQGGVSKPPFDSLNLGLHVGDAPLAVEHNRALYAKALQAKPVFFDQVHGVDCLQVDAWSPHGLKADAAWTHDRGVACTMMVADCMPLLLADAQARAVAAVHVGWRGLVGMDPSGGLLPHGVVHRAVLALRGSIQERYGSKVPQLFAWLGPCIGPSAFEVGSEVRQAFIQRAPSNAPCFIAQPQSPGHWLADLPQLVREELGRLGVEDLWGNDGTPGWCTVSQAALYFSHRREKKTGRFAASIWLE